MRIVAIILLVIAVIIGGFYFARNSIIETSVTTIGTNVLKTNVGVESVDFSPFSGTFNIKGLAIANPEGFSAGNALYLGEVNVKLSPMSLLSDTIKIEEVVITKPEINILGNVTSTNISRIQKNTEPKQVEEKPKATDHFKSDSTTNTPKNVEIRYLALKDAKLTASFNALSQKAAIDVPTIELHNIGTTENTSVAQAIALIMKEVVEVTKNVALHGADFEGKLENFKSELQKDADKLKDNFKDKLKSFGF